MAAQPHGCEDDANDASVDAAEEEAPSEEEEEDDDDASASSEDKVHEEEKEEDGATEPALSLANLSCACLLVALVCAAYEPLLDHNRGWGLTGEWDDRSNFLENELVRKPLSWTLVRAMFSATRVNVFEPLGWLAKALVQRYTANLEEASGLLTVDAWYHRVLSLALHAANAVRRTPVLL